MKEIQLTHGKATIVDDDDYEWLSKSSWRAMWDGFKWYALRDNWNHPTRMQRLIMKAPDKLGVDHINGDSLDNRKENLRLVTQSQNCQNRRKIISRSGYKGVHWEKGKYRSMIRVNSRLIGLGRFETAKEAAEAYNKAAIKYFGDYAFTNSIE